MKGNLSVWLLLLLWVLVPRARGDVALTTLVSFNSTNGASPYAALALGNDGNFYGTTSEGGVTNSTYPSGMGTVFQVTTNGTLTTLVSFNGSNGAGPAAGLTLGNDGNFYGTTIVGGITNFIYSGGMGTVFKVTTNGTLTTLALFKGTNGASPDAALTLGNDGNFYGTTQTGGITNPPSYYNGMGTVFQVTTNGALTTLVDFNGTNGLIPEAALTLGSDGNLYGMTAFGGASFVSGGSAGCGTVFRMGTNGALTTLVSFNGTNGGGPTSGAVGGLVQGSDGNFYGTSASGGASFVSGGSSYGHGTVFRMGTNGALTTLVDFNLTNGASPYAALALGNDGNFYGTTWGGGSAGYGPGTVFRVTPGGALTTLYSFTGGADGGFPGAALTLGSDGNFYGTSSHGGITNSTYTWGMGTVFRLVLMPVIAVQPQSQTNTAGTTATFLVSAASPNPLSYQWQKNGTNLVDGGNISGATTSTLTITSISDSDVASYSVIVSNSYGSVTSSNAVLTVNDSLFIAAQPQSQTVGLGSNVTFNVTVYGAPPFVFQWYFNGTPLGSPATGINFLSCTLTNVGTNQAGNYSVKVVNGYGSVTSSNAVLTVEVFPPSITVQPSNLLVLPGTNAAFGVSLSGTAPFGYQWRFNGTNILNATNALYTIPSVVTSNAGNYAVVITNAAGIVTSSNAALTVVLSPMSQTNYASSTAAFTATAFGPEALNYQWQKNGTNLVDGGRFSGTTNSTLTIASVSDADSADYSAVVSDAYGSVTTSNAALTVIDPPSITAQPLGQRIMLGSSVSFTVSVGGTAPFGYQWRFNGAGIPNATNAAYAIPAAGATNTGNYSVIVTNLAGSVTSSNAFLTVIVPPTLALQLLAGYPLLNLSGMLSSNFVVQYSTNLAGSNWINLLSLPNLPASPYLFLDPAGDGEPARFYRAFMQ
jgi:uncharacterized repeat protein (TIGR03803 family)